MLLPDTKLRLPISRRCAIHSGAGLPIGMVRNAAAILSVPLAPCVSDIIGVPARTFPGSWMQRPQSNHLCLGDERGVQVSTIERVTFDKPTSRQLTMAFGHNSTSKDEQEKTVHDAKGDTAQISSFYPDASDRRTRGEHHGNASKARPRCCRRGHTTRAS